LILSFSPLLFASLNVFSPDAIKGTPPRSFLYLSWRRLHPQNALFRRTFFLTAGMENPFFPPSLRRAFFPLPPCGGGLSAMERFSLVQVVLSALLDFQDFCIPFSSFVVPVLSLSLMILEFPPTPAPPPFLHKIISHLAQRSGNPPKRKKPFISPLHSFPLPPEK